MQHHTQPSWPPLPSSLCLPLQTEESCRLAWSRGTASSTSPKLPAAMLATTRASPPTACRGRSEPWWTSLWPVNRSLIFQETGNYERRIHAALLVICPTSKVLVVTVHLRVVFTRRQSLIIQHLLCAWLLFYSPVMKCIWVLGCNCKCYGPVVV